MFYKKLLFLVPIVLACNGFADPPKPDGGPKDRNFEFNVYMLDGGNMWGLRPKSIGVDVQHKPKGESDYKSIFSAPKEIPSDNTEELLQFDENQSVNKDIKKIHPNWHDINGYDLIYKGKENYDLKDNNTLNSVYMLKTQPINIEVTFPSDEVPAAGIKCSMQLMNGDKLIGTNNEFQLVKQSGKVWTYDKYYIKQNIELSSSCKNILKNANSTELNCINEWTESSYNIGLPTGLSSDYSFNVTLPEIEGLVGSYDLSTDYSTLTITYTTELKSVDFNIQSYFLDGNDLWGLRPENLEVKLNGFKATSFEFDTDEVKITTSYEAEASEDTGVLDKSLKISSISNKDHDFEYTANSGKIDVYTNSLSKNVNLGLTSIIVSADFYPRIVGTWDNYDTYKLIEPSNGQSGTNGITPAIKVGQLVNIPSTGSYNIDSIYQLQSYPLDIKVEFDMKGWNSFQPTEDIKVSISANGGTTSNEITLTNADSYTLQGHWFKNNYEEQGDARVAQITTILEKQLDAYNIGIPKLKEFTKYQINVPEIDYFDCTWGGQINPNNHQIEFSEESNKFLLNITATLNTTTISPTITWVDNNDQAKKRPDSVNLTFKDYSNEIEIYSTDSWSKEFNIPSSIASSFSFEGSTVPEFYIASYEGENVTYTYNGDLKYTGTWERETIDGLGAPSSVTTSQSEGNVFTYDADNTTFFVKNGKTFDLKIEDPDDKWWFDVVPNHDDFTFTIFARGYAVANKSTFKKYKTVEEADTEENAAYELIALKNIDISNITLNNPLWINTDKWTLRAHSISATQGATIIVNAEGTLDLDINKNVFVRCEEGGKLIFD